MRVNPDAAAEVAFAHLDAPRVGDARARASYAQLVRESDRLFRYITELDRPGACACSSRRARPRTTVPRELVTSVRCDRMLEVSTVACERDRLHPVMSCERGGEYDRFRAVHDVVGHGRLQVGFDRDGEFAAWRFQERLHSTWLDAALATELHGEHSVRWTTGDLPEHKAFLFDERSWAGDRGPDGSAGLGVLLGFARTRSCGMGATVTVITPTQESNTMSDQKPTVVLVHGAFAESASWNPVIEQLQAQGLETVAVANPLRSLTIDAAYVRDVIAGIGHACRARRSLLRRHGHHRGRGRERRRGRARVRRRVCAGRTASPPSPSRPSSPAAPSATRSARTRCRPAATSSSSGRKSSTTSSPPTSRGADGAHGGDPAAGHRGGPLRGAADRRAGVEDTPSWFVFGELDQNIPAELQRFMAERAGAKDAQRSLAARTH